MLVSMGGNAGDGKVVDGKVISDVVASKTSDTRDSKYVASKGGDVGDNGGMIRTCGGGDEGGAEVSGANGVDDVDGGNIVSCVDRPPARPLARPPAQPPPRPLARPPPHPLARPPPLRNG